MLSLRKSSYFATIFSLTFFGCSTSSYRVLFQNDTAAELSVPPDRILLECEDLYDADIKGLYGFMMHILDQENRVITLIQGNTLDKWSCERRLKDIGKIMREGETIYIAGIGNLNNIDPKSHEEYLFPKKGKFRSNGKTLSFVAIANEHGLCYDAYDGFAQNPCPEEPFPYWNRPKK